MAISRSSGTNVVFDASALVRALVDLDRAARQWLERIAKHEVVPVWPAHLYAEVANSLVRLARADMIDARRAGRVFGRVRRIPANVGPAEALEQAMAVALDRQLTVYDAAYVVLAEALGAPLVTADRRLAEATNRGVLLAE